jgi:CRISPR-associated protein Cas2
MPMTVVVTTAVPMRFRGFLASCMLELAPGVYSHPRLSKAVRERIWAVLQGWWDDSGGGGSVLMLWEDTGQPGGQGVACLGLAQRTIVEYEGFLLSKGAD